MEEAALAALDTEALIRDASAFVRIPSVTGDERAALEWLAAQAAAYGLEADLHQHDLAALRAHPEHPGEEAPREQLWGLTVRLPGSRPGRIALNGHVDVVSPGTEPWRLGPWSGAVEDGRLHGRGSVDMKGPVISALHALVALREVDHPEVVLMAVPSEEDGGLGTFAALQRDARFDAALIPEPTGLRVVCAQAGALTFKGEIRGVATHAAERLAGHSAIDRYVKVHAALARHEQAVNADVAHPLMRELELPYPLVVGQLRAGEWSSMVPDQLVFEGRLGVPVGVAPETAREELQRVVDAALDDDLPRCVLTWEGGAFASGTTDPEHPWVKTVQDALAAETGRAPLAGVPWGADLRLFTARGIPTVMVGTRGIELAHAVDENVSADELATIARTMIRAIARS
ncbi:M20/M25/M40 family metallo-hydrolase [Solirubrobacter phytolaccae]|uniref:M20/M25/M40 family metallo-hydrolase n=1 Tax=Solirubrobacter phytolaccae TaxID=1404360 RepID=A0A9X3NAM0_9ACTN|nr:M20/M25/M40 family metallo-hydrolase [Solirubrobacter phytolaccae]MDA0181554.1 M20/M25/M40 family metallo-hydrolase [Solirubrobacter phytolaccae]